MSHEGMGKLAGVTVYGLGIVHASVCAPSDMPIADMLRDANHQTGPIGLDHGWVLSDDATFSGGEPNPCPCDQQPDSHLHYLLEC
jgi:hypothetical protein